MNRENLFQALSGLDDRYIAEAMRYAPGEAAGSPERIVPMKKKRIITLALAAVLILALGVGAYAAGAAVSTPEAAERVAREQLEAWKALGIISPDFVIEGPADTIVEIPEQDGGAYWYGRIFRHRYDVRWYFGWEGEPRYSCSLSVDTLSGKITAATFYVAADENDVPTREIKLSSEDGTPRTAYYYDLFDEIFPADETLDRFCTLLAEYWGFSGYRLDDTVDGFYHSNFSAPDGSTLLLDLPTSNGGHYVTIFFDGDPDGAPMYLELNQFPGHDAVIIGTNHAVG